MQILRNALRLERMPAGCQPVRSRTAWRSVSLLPFRPSRSSGPRVRVEPRAVRTQGGLPAYQPPPGPRGRGGGRLGGGSPASAPDPPPRATGAVSGDEAALCSHPARGHHARGRCELGRSGALLSALGREQRNAPVPLCAPVVGAPAPSALLHDRRRVSWQPAREIRLDCSQVGIRCQILPLVRVRVHVVELFAAVRVTDVAPAFRA